MNQIRLENIPAVHEAAGKQIEAATTMQEHIHLILVLSGR